LNQKTESAIDDAARALLRFCAAPTDDVAVKKQIIDLYFEAVAAAAGVEKVGDPDCVSGAVRDDVMDEVVDRMKELLLDDDELPRPHPSNAEIAAALQSFAPAVLH
jgi:hypothetical protein